MRQLQWVVWLMLLAPVGGTAQTAPPIELHQTLAPVAGSEEKVVALTLDACGGGVDQGIIDFLIEHRIPATIFVTRRWLRRNPTALELLKTHADLFDIENHGAKHLPAVIGIDRQIYGIPGVADLAAVKREVADGAAAVEAATGIAPRWYRGATASYDLEAIKAIEAMGYKVAGFSVNADHGGLFAKDRVVSRLKKVRSQDIILAHLNRPASGTRAGLAEGLTWLQENGFQFVMLRDSEVSDAR
ncbi:MAG: polysaccharide deacetylase family protein [Burkholderiales bacterium]